MIVSSKVPLSKSMPQPCRNQIQSAIGWFPKVNPMEPCYRIPHVYFSLHRCRHSAFNTTCHRPSVTVATGLPVAGHARLHQQPLTLVVVVGCNLVRQRRARSHDAHPFCQDGKNTKGADRLDYWLDLQVFVLTMAQRTAYCTSESRLPLCA